MLKINKLAKGAKFNIRCERGANVIFHLLINGINIKRQFVAHSRCLSLSLSLVLMQDGAGQAIKNFGVEVRLRFIICASTPDEARATLRAHALNTPRRHCATCLDSANSLGQQQQRWELERLDSAASAGVNDMLNFSCIMLRRTVRMLNICSILTRAQSTVKLRIFAL